MAADRGERPRDARGRFLPKEEAAKAKRSRATKSKATKVQGKSTASVTPRSEPALSQPLGAHAGPEVDAMGLDKRRTVAGGSYGPSLAKQATLYGTFIAIVAALGLGFVLLANELDQPPESNPAEAPWATTPADQPPPRDLDFPRTGDPDL